MQKKDKNWAWDETWREGHLSSLWRENEAGPSGASIAAWNSFFDTLPSSARILDICTGNGIVPAIANAFSREHDKNFDLVGVDQAAIDPLATVREQAELLEGIEFIGNVPAEDLPFPEASFDAVTGQYALEYTDVDRSVGQIAGVLSNGGRVRFVIHAKEGAIYETNAPKVEQFEYILRHSGVVEGLRQAVQCAMRYGASGKAADKDAVLAARETLRARVVAAKTRTAAMGPPEDAANFLDDLVKGYLSWPNFKSVEEFEAWLAAGIEQAERLVLMLRALTAAALTREEMRLLREKFATNGFSKLRIGDVKLEDAHLHGWTLRGVWGE